MCGTTTTALTSSTRLPLTNWSVIISTPKNGELYNNNSVGRYDENGNLIERTDFNGKPHYIKELGEYRLPHTHHYKWDYIKGAWRIIKKWLTP